MKKCFVSWQYCKDPNEINEVIKNGDPNWEYLESADQIINIIWNPEHRLYQVFWRIPDDSEHEVFWQTSEVTIEDTKIG